MSLTSTQERRLQIDLHMLRQAYENREINDILWLKGDSNPADALTKEGANAELSKLLSSQTFEPDTWSVIARDEVPVRTDTA